MKSERQLSKIEPQALSEVEMSYTTVLMDLADKSKDGLDDKIACVNAGLGSASMRDKDKSGCVGAVLGGGFDHTPELYVMKFKQAMKSVDKEQWQKAVDEEYERMRKNKVWEAVKCAGRC